MRGGAAFGLLLSANAAFASGTVWQPELVVISHDLQCEGRPAMLTIEETATRAPAVTYNVALKKVVPLGGTSAVEAGADVKAAFAKMHHVEKVSWGCGGNALSLMITYADKERFQAMVDQPGEETQKRFNEPFEVWFSIDAQGIRLSAPASAVQ